MCFLYLRYPAVPEQLWEWYQQVPILYGYVERVQEELWFYDGCIITYGYVSPSFWLAGGMLVDYDGGMALSCWRPMDMELFWVLNFE